METKLSENYKSDCFELQGCDCFELQGGNCFELQEGKAFKNNKEMMIKTQKLVYYSFDAIGSTSNCNKPEGSSKLNIYDNKK